MTLRPPAHSFARALILALPYFAAACIGCGRSEQRAHAAATDSAGVRIVESTRPEQGFVEVHGNPVYATRLGENATPLHRVVGVSMFGDSLIAVAEASSSKIHLFSPSRGWVRSYGGKGDGPNELRSPQRLITLGPDTLAVLDVGGNIKLLTPYGFVGQSRVPYLLDQLHRLDDGSWIGLASSATASTGEIGRPSQPLVRILGGVADTLRAMPGPTRITQSPARGAFRTSTVAFAARSLVAARGAEILAGSASSHEVVFLNDSGDVTQIARWHGSDLSIHQEDVAAWRAAYAANAYTPPGQDPAILEKLVRELPVARHKPAYSGILVSDKRDIWILATTLADPHESFVVLSESGAWQQEVSMPERFRTYHITRDIVLGVAKTTNGEEEVRLYRLQ